MAHGYRHEHGMGSRRRHGRKIDRWDTRRTVKESARHSRGNQRIEARKTLREEASQ